MECVIICLQAPEAGKVLKGLSDVFTPEQCVKLYQAMIDDSLEYTQEMGLKRVVGCMPAKNHPYFQELSKRVYIEMEDLPGQTPGTRVKNALSIGFKKGANQVALWDGSAPHFPPKLFKESFSRLGKAQILLSPAMDYTTFLIAAQGKAPDIFEKVRWDTAAEFAQLYRAAEQAQLSPHIHQTWWRLRTKNDLPYYLMSLKSILEIYPRLGRHTRKVLEEFNIVY